jgi:hypothetical protein
MNDGQTPPLAVGEYARPVSLLARSKLIGRIRQLLPQFFEDLARDVFPLYSPIAVSGGDSSSSQFEFQAALKGWATKFNAEEPWLLENVMHLAKLAREPQFPPGQGLLRPVDR